MGKGKWTLESVLARTEKLDTKGLFGNHYIVSFRLRCEAGTFVETPTLEWNEIIMMNEHHKKECWVFQANMYAHKPGSGTLKTWAKRYIAAFDSVVGNPADVTMKGSVRLQDKDMKPLAKDAFDKKLKKDLEKAEAVRKYLKDKGGVMFIEIDDIPSINHPTDDEHKERLLIFDCGVAGNKEKRTKAIQLLSVNVATDVTQWTKQFDLSHSVTKLGTTGLKNVKPPESVSKPNTLLAAGEYL